MYFYWKRLPGHFSFYEFKISIKFDLSISFSTRYKKTLFANKQLPKHCSGNQIHKIFLSLMWFLLFNTREINYFNSPCLYVNVAEISYHSPNLSTDLVKYVWAFAGKRPKYRSQLQMLFDQMVLHWLGNSANAEILENKLIYPSFEHISS